MTEPRQRHVGHRCPDLDRHYAPENLPVPCPKCYSIESIWRRIPWEPDSSTPAAAHDDPTAERLAQLLWQQDMKRRDFTPPVTWDAMVETAPAKRIFRAAADEVLAFLAAGGVSDA